MNKFSFKMKDRMKIVVEKVANNSFTLTVSGKEDVTFRFSKKRAAELVKHFQSVVTFGTAEKFEFRKSVKAPAGNLSLTQPTNCVESYCLTIYKDTTKIFQEVGMSKKQVKKMIKVMREVYGVE